MNMSEQLKSRNYNCKVYKQPRKLDNVRTWPNQECWENKEELSSIYRKWTLEPVQDGLRETMKTSSDPPL